MQVLSPLPTGLETAQSWANFAQSILTSVAFATGAGWVIFNFLSRREYRRRLEPTLKASVLKQNDQIHILIEYELTSIGYSKVEITSSSIQIYAGKSYEELGDAIKGLRLNWTKVAVYPNFVDHHWIELGETIREAEVVSIPSQDYLAFKVEMTLVTGAAFAQGATEWNTSTAIFDGQQKGDQG